MEETSLLWLLFLTSLLSCPTNQDLIVVTVHPGDDVILPCQAADSSIRAVEWSRPDLEPDIVLLYSDGHLDIDNQNPSFRGRVDLVDRDLKDGDVSLILKNVNRHDAGTYECRVITDGSRHKKRAILDFEPITIIHLQVTEPAGLHDELAAGVLAAGFPVGLILVAVVAVAGVLKYKRHKNKRSGQPADY